MKFLLAIYGNEEMWGSLSKEEFDALIAEHGAFEQEVRESGELVSVEGLSDAVNARTVRVRDGVPVVTDGPYAETQEVLAGYWIVECDSFDRATEIAARLATCPAPPEVAATAVADVRPLVDSRTDLEL